MAKRYEQRATTIASYLDFQKWDQAFENKLLGSATIDQLRHNAYLVVLEGLSYRAQRLTQLSKKNWKRTQKQPKKAGGCNLKMETFTGPISRSQGGASLGRSQLAVLTGQ
ncbi:MAG: ATP-binding protein [Desulfohalobiaceae bacterium]